MSHLDGDARHDGGDVARRIGVRRGQPDVQRKKAGLHAETDQRQPEQRRQLRVLAHRAEFPTSGARRQSGEEGEEAQRARVRRRQIQPARRAHFAPLAVKRDQKIRRRSRTVPTR